MRIAALRGGAQVLSALLVAAGLAVDFTGVSITGFSTVSIRISIAITFIIFAGLTAWHEIERRLKPRPEVVWDGLLPEKGVAMKEVHTDSYARRTAYFTRLSFKNKSKSPSGEESTAKSMTASVNIYDIDGNEIDSWEGRWANNDEPYDLPSKYAADRLDLVANNQIGILDIGLRFEGDMEFYGWNNNPNPISQFGGFIRGAIVPNQYKLKITLYASNMKAKEWWFTFNVPSVSQDDNPNQVEITQIRKPEFHK